ncbi:MAG TPA: O-antigen ligase family protein, partial [Pirellulaceae bacterium]
MSPIARDSWQMANHNASAALESASSHGSSCVSLHPWRTRESLGQLAMLLAVYQVAVTTCRSRERVVWLLGLVAVNGALLTLFGLVQQFTWNGKLYWFLELTQGGAPFASFVNRNNAAGYLNMCLGAAVGLGMGSYVGSRGDSRRHPRSDAVSSSVWFMWLTVAAFTMAGIFATLSRGGVIAFFIAGVWTTLAVSRCQRGQRGTLPVALIMAVAGIAISLWLSSGVTLDDRFEDIWKDNVESPHGRLTHWRDALTATTHFLPLGSGLGTYRYVYRAFERGSFPGLYYHAENQYVEATLELGIVGGLLALALAGISILIVHRGLMSAQSSMWFGVAAGSFFAVTSQVIHALSDFGLYLPANMCLAATWLGVATVQSRVGAPRAVDDSVGRSSAPRRAARL